MSSSLSIDLTRTSQVIGFSGLGKPLLVNHIGRRDSPLKIFIIAGQHGDESGSRKAAERLVESLEPEAEGAELPIHVSVLADANPDGSYARRRENDSGIDLNRDHLLLKSSETLAIHSYASLLRPQIIVDVHNYPPRRKRLLAEDRIIDADVFLDTTTIPDDILSRPVKGLGEGLVQSVKSDLTARGFGCERYLLFKPSGKVRTSGLGLSDARNSLSLKYGALGVIVEGRSPTKRDEPEERERLLEAQNQALRSILWWAWRSKELLTADARPKNTSSIPVRWKYERSDKLFEVPFQSSRTGSRYTVALTQCHSDIKTTLKVPLPYGYAIPNQLSSVIEILRRHGFEEKSIDASLLTNVQVIPMRAAAPELSAQEGGTMPRNARVEYQNNTSLIGSYTFFTGSTDDRVFLTLLLDSESKYGLWHHCICDPGAGADQHLPVLRLMHKGEGSIVGGTKVHDMGYEPAEQKS